MHIAAIRLGLGLIFGLLIVSGYVVVPILFAQADSSTEAGRLAGHIFAAVNQGVLLLAVALAAFWFKLRQVSPPSHVDWMLLVLLAALVGANGWLVAPEIESIKHAAGAIDQLAKDDPLRMKFGMWHGVSSILHLLASLAAAVLLMKGAGTQTAACQPSGKGCASV